MTNSTFEGKVVLVTGANSGIGEATAVAFDERGATVFGSSRREDRIEVERSRHPSIRWVVADVTQQSDAKAAVDTVVRETGRLDVLVNNAGVYLFKTLEESTEDLVRAEFEANVYGPTFFAQAALPALKESRGTIVNMSSVVGHKPAPGAAHYGATKAALESLTRSWALELAPYGVRVNAVAPGPTETHGFEKGGMSPEEVHAIKDDLVRHVPLGRMASTDEIARWILALADPGVTWVTGAVFSVDGGMGLA